MRISIPGVPGVYYDSDAKSTALTTALSLVGRKAPKPKGYALQVLPHVWSFDVDLREVPADHPFHYLHPEGAHSIEELTREQAVAPGVGREVELLVQYVWAVNREAERSIDAVLDREIDEEGLVIEIDDGGLRVAHERSDGRRIEIDEADAADEPTEASRPDVEDAGVRGVDPADELADERAGRDGDEPNGDAADGGDAVDGDEPGGDAVDGDEPGGDAVDGDEPGGE